MIDKSKKESKQIQYMHWSDLDADPQAGMNKINEIIDLLNCLPTDLLENMIIKSQSCWCGKPIDKENLDCVIFKLCKDHATEA